MRTIKIMLLTALLSACSTHEVKTASSVDLIHYGKDIKLAVTGADADIADKLSRYIQANLLIEGFNVVSDDAATHLDVTLSEFDPGNAALRLTIGFGAGRGSLVYNAKYSKNGKILIDYDGAERFTGMEIAPGTKYEPTRNFGGAETSTLILLEEASKHIVDQATGKHN